ncbi:MAG: flagellar hook-length control protein FliK [Sedimentibacter sp.]|uniref:flagellar hook-length control protein FliK n=1 Tax=Sedimentibacter sp. TaxID=1960295 RepID=UPI0031595688
MNVNLTNIMPTTGTRLVQGKAATAKTSNGTFQGMMNSMLHGDKEIITGIDEIVSGLNIEGLGGFSDATVLSALNTDLGSLIGNVLDKKDEAITSLLNQADDEAFISARPNKLSTKEETQDEKINNSMVYLAGISGYGYPVNSTSQLKSGYENYPAGNVEKNMSVPLFQAKQEGSAAGETIKAEGSEKFVGVSVWNNQVTENSNSYSTFAKKLISQIEGSRNKLKQEIDYNAGIARSNLPDYSSRIIQVSDVSSEIKSSVMSQIEDRIVLMVNEGTDGTKNVTMELNPENLGKVDIKMTYENNSLTVEVKAHNEETHKLLLSNSEELAKVLNKVSEGSVNVVVKNQEPLYEQSQLYYSQDRERQQQKNTYVYKSNDKDDEENNDFEQIMRLSAMP